MYKVKNKYLYKKNMCVHFIYYFTRFPSGKPMIKSRVLFPFWIALLSKFRPQLGPAIAKATL